VPPFACSNRPCDRLVAPVKAPRSWPNSSLSISRHVDRHEGAGAPLAVIVQRARDQFLAGAGLAVDHDRQVGGREAGDRAVNFLHRGAAADQRQAFFRIARFGHYRAGFRRRRERSPDHRQQLRQVERLGQIFERATLRRLHRRHQGGLRAHDDNAQVRADALDAGDQVQPVFVRHHHVGDDQIALPLLHPAPEAGGIRGTAHLISRSAQSLGQYGADRTVVVGDQNGRQSHWSASFSVTTGRCSRKSVRPGRLSTSIKPP
jgi:hypothetical protein